MACETVWGHSGITGAPELYGAAGQGITFLDAVLKDGYGEITLTSLEVSSGTATATYSSGHTFPQWLVVAVSGVTDLTGLNGRKRILTADGTTFTFDATGVSDGTASGTVKAKVPGAGWTKAYSDTNKGAYRVDTVAGTGCYMRVDDSGSLDMRVVFYLAMSDVDTGTDPYPTAAQVSGGCYLRKSTTVDATARAWMFVADDRFMYLCVNSNGAGTAYRSGMGGDYNKFGDYVAPYDSLVSMAASAGSTAYLGYGDGSTSNQKVWQPRLFDATPGAVVSSKSSPYLVNSANVTGSTYPSPQTGGVMAAYGTFVNDGANNTQKRGLVPGHVVFMNNCAADLAWATPLVLDGFSAPVLPLPLTDSGAPWMAVDLGDWR